MNIIFADRCREQLLPLTFTRPVAELRVGRRVIREKWTAMLPCDAPVSYLTADYLQAKYPFMPAKDGDNLFIFANVCPAPDDDVFTTLLRGLQKGWRLTCNGLTVCARCADIAEAESLPDVPYEGELSVLGHHYDIFHCNGAELRRDWAVAPRGDSAPLSPSCTLIGDPSQLYIAPDAKVEGAIINVTHGPVYISEGAEVMEGSCLRGPIALCEHATVNMCTKIYPDTTIGPWSKVGGELNNVVITGYSNKAHDGFLGNAVIGEWCNLGAGCTASNLKNNYAFCRVWDYATQTFARTKLQFCGLIMGDHSKAGINTMFNTATVVGVAANIYGAGFPRNFIASFSQGSAAGFMDQPVERVFETAEKVMGRRGRLLTDVDRDILRTIAEITREYK